MAAPRTWRELASKSLSRLDYREVLRRVRRRGDRLASLVPGRLESMVDGPKADSAGGRPPDRLADYRSKRSAEKTPEPVTAERAKTTDGRSFIIQEYHARRLHFDLRLEHDGVLVSWALPKGVSTEPKKNHLVVQREDPPLEYGTVEGTIPAGQYGGGEVTIWDAATHDLKKWRDGKKIIATLRGRKGGGPGSPRRLAPIHTGQLSPLIHLKKEASGVLNVDANVE